MLTTLINMLIKIYSTLPADASHSAPGRMYRLFTTMPFVLDRRREKSAANFAGTDMKTVAYKEAGRRGLERGKMPVDKRIEVLSYLVGFLVPFAISVSDTRGMEKQSQLFKVKFEGVPKQVRMVNFADGGSGGKTNVYQEAGTGFL